MDELGPYTYSVGEDAAVSALRRIVMRSVWRPPFLWGTLMVIALSVGLVVWDMLDGWLNLASTAIALSAGPLALVLLYFGVGRQARRQYRQSAALRDETSVTIRVAELFFQSSRGHTIIPLAELYGWTETDTLIILRQTEIFSNLIPKAALGEAAEILKERLVAAGVDRR